MELASKDRQPMMTLLRGCNTRSDVLGGEHRLVGNSFFHCSLFSISQTTQHRRPTVGMIDALKES